MFSPDGVSSAAIREHRAVAVGLVQILVVGDAV